MVATRLRDALRRASTLASGAGGGEPIDSAIVRPGPNDVGRLRRERRRILREREGAIRDLGGLALEMTRRRTMKPDLLRRRGEAIVGLEERVHALDEAIAVAVAATPAPAITTLAVCDCGEVVEADASYCPSCARPIGARADATSAGASLQPRATCAACDGVLPAAARYCPACGVAAAGTGDAR